MSNARAFHLRKHVNALQRLAVQRCYTTEASKTSHTLEEQTSFLRAQDQHALHQTQEHLDVFKDHFNKINEQFLSFATISSAIWDPQDEKKARKRERRGYPTHMPPYTSGYLRQQVRETQKIVQKVLAQADHIGDHLTDLRYEPYPEHGVGFSSTAAWEAEMAKMSREEQEEQLFELQLKEEAAYAQLRGDSRLLVERASQVAAMLRSGKGEVDLDAPSRPVFQQEAEEGSSRITFTRDSGGKVKETESTAQPTATASLSKLQKRLEESMRK